MRLEDYIKNVQHRACVDLVWVKRCRLSVIAALLSSTFQPKAGGRRVGKINASLLFARLSRIIWLAGLSPWSPKLNPRPIHVGFVVKDVRSGQVFLREQRCILSSIIPSVFHTYSMSLPKL